MLSVAVVTYISVFAGAAAVLEILGDEVPSVGVLAVIGVLAAMTFNPLQVMLRGVVDELLFGRRPDPLDAASRVAGQVGDDPAQALRVIREALLLPYAALRAGGRELAASGTADTHTRTFPLDGAEAELVVGLRPGDLSLSSGDAHVLRLVAPLLAQTLRARALAADLQESREATITAVEEERRRLRRDLHDGLGPRLSGIAFTSDAVRNLVRADPDAADALLVQLRSDTTTAIEDIRRLVYAMRPPALDELGPGAGAAPAVRGPAGQRRAGGAGGPRRARGAPDAVRCGRGGGVPDRRRGADQRRPARGQRPRDGVAAGRGRHPPSRGRRPRWSVGDGVDCPGSASRRCANGPPSSAGR